MKYFYWLLVFCLDFLFILFIDCPGFAILKTMSLYDGLDLDNKHSNNSSSAVREQNYLCCPVVVVDIVAVVVIVVHPRHLSMIHRSASAESV